MPTLTWDDLAAIQTEVTTVKAAAPSLRSNQSLVSEEMNWTTSVTGTTPDTSTSATGPSRRARSSPRRTSTAGRRSSCSARRSCRASSEPTANPVGQTVRIGNMPFTVVGVAAKKGQSATGQDYDDAAFIPSTTFAHRIQGGLGKFLSGQMYVQATSSETTQRALEDISALLRDRHHIAPGADDDFSIRNLSEIAGAQAQGTETMTTLLASVAAVSLLVGGIGIMNIMLVSVTERTREIGIRMAIGAKPASILLQFLIEALVLSLAGGLDRRRARRRGRDVARRQVPLADADPGRRHRRVGGLQRARRRGLRAVPGAKGLAARPDRRPTLRVTRRAD